MKHAYQITQIDNGWLVAKQPSSQSEPPTVQYCENFSAVCATLKQTWPREREFNIVDK